MKKITIVTVCSLLVVALVIFFLYNKNILGVKASKDVRNDIQLQSFDGKVYSFNDSTSKLTLVSFICLSEETDSKEMVTTRGQMTLLSSISNQYSGMGLKINIVMSKSAECRKPANKGDQLNFLMDWKLNEADLLFDTEDNQLAKRYSITQLPTTLLLNQNNDVINRWSGVLSITQVAQEINAVLGHPQL